MKDCFSIYNIFIKKEGEGTLNSTPNGKITEVLIILTAGDSECVLNSQGSK